MNKYVMCKGFYGLGGSLAVLASAMRLANTSGRELIIDWKEGAYRIDNKDVFELLFDSPKLKGPDRFKWDEYKVWPDYWQPFVKQTKPQPKTVNLSRVTVDEFEKLPQAEKEKQDIVVITRDDKYWHKPEYHDEMSSLMKTIVPNRNIREKVTAFVKSQLGENAIGVHYRHGNGERSVIPPDIAWFYKSIDEFLAISQASKIFLCTDCYAVIENFVERYGDRVVFIEKEYPELGSIPMHRSESAEGRLKHAVEAVVDIWTLSKCSYIVGSKSFFTGVAAKINGGRGKNYIRRWAPENRSFKKPDGYEPLEDYPLIHAGFNAKGIKTDNIYIEKNGDTYNLYYLYNSVGSFRENVEVDYSSIEKTIKKYRLY